MDKLVPLVILDDPERTRRRLIRAMRDVKTIKKLRTQRGMVRNVYELIVMTVFESLNMRHMPVWLAMARGCGNYFVDVSHFFHEFNRFMIHHGNVFDAPDAAHAPALLKLHKKYKMALDVNPVLAWGHEKDARRICRALRTLGYAYEDFHVDDMEDYFMKNTDWTFFNMWHWPFDTSRH